MNSSRKSNSSGSSASKPTFRRAGGRGAPRVSPSRAPRASSGASRAPQRKPISSYSTPTKSTRRKAVTARSASGMAQAKPAPRKIAVQKAPKPQRASAQQAASMRSAGASQPKARPTKRKPTAHASAPVLKKRTAPRSAPASSFVSVAAKPRPAKEKRTAKGTPSIKVPHIALPSIALPGGVIAAVVGAVAVVAVLVIVVMNAPIFAATNIQLNGSPHVSQHTVEQLAQIPDGTTLLNVNAEKITESLESNPWVEGVDIERQFPNTLIITPHERTIAAIAYITADDIAWAISDDGTWIAPISLAVTVDAEGNVVGSGAGNPAPVDENNAAASTGEPADAATTDGDAGTDAAGDAGGDDAASSSDASDSAGATDAAGEGDAAQQVPQDGSQQLSGLDAALALARQNGVLLFADVAADVDPSSNQPVTSEVIRAGIDYANGFSDDFIAQIQYLSLPSIEAITAYLTSGVEVALGAPEDIQSKELIVTRLLEQEHGVTYINVRTPDSYSFRSAPAE